MSSPRQAHDQKNCVSDDLCERCAADQAFLRSNKRTPVKLTARVLRAADLFSGCGAMSVGLDEAARRAGLRLEVALAADSDSAVVDIYRKNIAETAKAEDVGRLFDGKIGAAPTTAEKKVAAEVGHLQILLGGPPCQGHSDLNNHTRRRDPKNALYLSIVRAAEVLLPDFVIIENVAAVQLDKAGVVQTAITTLKDNGYSVDGRVVNLGLIGVPQRRRRFVLVASRIADVQPEKLLDSLTKGWADHPVRTVRWAIEDLLDIDAKSTFDTASQKSAENAARMAYLFEKGRYNLPNDQRPKCHQDGDHSYVSVYGRLRWDRPAQTITTGFGSMGQGRYVHPQRRRTITPHEAARLQTFPDWFDFGEKTRRGVLAKAIGNAVPPLLMVELGRLVIAALAEHQSLQRKRA